MTMPFANFRDDIKSYSKCDCKMRIIRFDIQLHGSKTVYRYESTTYPVQTAVVL